MTEQQAKLLGESEFWKGMTFRERAIFQLFEPLLCMPFDVFHEAVEKTLVRPVFAHEFGSSGLVGLKQEIMGHRPPPTIEEIIGMIPAEKRVLISTGVKD